MTLGEVMLAHYMYQVKEVEEWKRTRSIMYVIAKLLGDSKRIGSIENFFPLPFDDAKSNAQLEKEEIDAIFEKLKANG
jgi:hypothetical protein